MSDLNDVLIAAHSDDVASGGKGFLQDVAEFVDYGIPSAAISGGVGIWNSLKGVANTFGTDLPMTRTEDVIADVVSTDGRNYYVENKVGADVAGFALTAIVTSFAAVKALRAWQAGGKLSAGAVNATGIANADIVLASSQVQAYRAAVTSNAMSYSWRNPKFIGALGAATKQNVGEALVAEAAFMLTHNQSVVLNPDSLSAWDSSKRAFTEGLPFTVGFAALGTGLDAFRIVGYGRKAFDADVMRLGTANAKLSTPLADAVSTYNVPGDRMYDMLRLQEDLEKQAADGALDIADDVQRARYNGAIKQLQTAHDEALLEAVKGGDEFLLASARDMSTQVQARTDALDKVSILGNLQGIVRAGLQEARTGWNFASKTMNVQRILPDTPYSQLLSINREKLRGNSVMFARLADMLRGKAGSDFTKQLLEYGLKTKDQKLVSVLYDASQTARRRHIPAEEFPARQLLAEQGLDLGKFRIHPEHAEAFVDALATVATRMSSSVNGAAHAKAFPALADLFNSAGAAARAGDETVAYYNVRTGKAATDAMLRAQDIGPVSDNVYAATVKGVGTFTVDGRKAKATSVLQRMAKGDLEDMDVPLDVSTQWAVYAGRKLNEWAPAEIRLMKSLPDTPVTFTVPIDDLPALERVATGMRAGDRLQIKDGAVLDKQQALDAVIQQKIAARSAYQIAGMNERQIAVLLNSGEDFALGIQGADDALLMGKLDYTKPETLRLEYKKYGTEDTELAARSFEGLAARMEHQAGVEAAAAARVLNPDEARFLPNEDMELVQSLSLTDWTTGMLSSTDAIFGTMRQWAQNVGAIAHKMKDTSRQTVNKLFLGHYQRLTAPDSASQRTQLALLVNAMRTDDYTLVRLTEELTGKEFVTHVAVKYSVYQKHVADWVANGGTPETAEQYFRSAIGAEEVVANKAGMLLHRDVGELMEMHKELNRKYCANDKALATAKRKFITRSPDILYPPPVNLHRTPHFVFVRPKAGVEMPSYMIYANTADELTEKIAYVQKHYGGKFDVVNNADVKLYKQLRGEYDEGRVFNQWDFDPALPRMGKTGNLQPSLDINSAETLDLMRNWHHTKREHQIMEAIEVKYSSTTQALRAAGEVYGAADNAAKMGLATGKRDVFTDTRRLMLDTHTYDGELARSYRNVQAEIGSALSKHLDTIGYSMAQLWQRVRGKEKGFTMGDFDKLNDVLAKQGFENPYEDLGMLLTRSEVISDGRTLGQATRLLNTFVATTTLRADVLNSVVQVLSSPILYSGVVREAKRALAGTPAGKRLQDMTTVANPTNGVREPTAMKLFMNATKKYFTAEGARFGDELRARGILTDYQREFLDASDFTSLNGRHTIHTLQSKMDHFAEFVGKWSGHQRAEDYTRFIIAHAMKEIGELRGMQGEELYGMIRNGVDKMHGILRKNQRAQLFNGVIGQSMGLFQTYVFNYAQRMVRHLTDGAGKDAAIAMALQGTMFGVRSLPGFGMMNHWVSTTNSGQLDIYTLAGTDADPTGFGSYILYGLGSNLSLIPTDAFSRGDIALRNATVVPVNPVDWPAVTMLAKFIGATVDAGKQWSETGDFTQALAYGLAHNALNRPLQGIGTAWLGAVTTNTGTPMFTNANYRNYQNNGELAALMAHPGWDEATDFAEAVNWAAIGARLVGGKPRDEAILMDSYYRRTAYQSEMRSKTVEIGEQLRVKMLAGEPIDDATYTDFATRFERAGGLPENFGQFFTRNLAAAGQSSVEEFRSKMQEDNAFSRTYNRLREERSEVPLWQLDGAGGTGGM